MLADFSVHSFVDLGITGWLVFNMGFFLVVSIALLAFRWREIPSEVGDEPFMSRTIFFVVGILLFILIGLVVLFGTSAPLISRIWGEPAQVGPEFYNAMGFWIAVAFAVSFIKDTALVSQVGVFELTFRGKELNNQGYSGILVFGTIAFCYFLLSFPLSLLGQYLEKRLGTPRGQRRTRKIWRS